jgi:hypothetical protein
MIPMVFLNQNQGAPGPSLLGTGDGGRWPDSTPPTRQPPSVKIPGNPLIPFAKKLPPVLQGIIPSWRTMES